MGTGRESHLLLGALVLRPMRRAGRFLRTAFLPPKPFPGAAEADFLAGYARQFAAHRRAVVVLFLLTWLALLAGDVYYDFSMREGGKGEKRDLVAMAMAIRILGVFLMLGLRLILRRATLLNERRMTWLLSALFLSSVAMTVAITGYSGDFVSISFFLQIGILLLFLYGLLRLRSMAVLANAVACLAISFGGVYQLDGTALLSSSWTYLATGGSLLAFMVIGTLVAIQLERSARASFAREQRLIAVRKDLASVNRALREAEQETAIKTDALLAAKDAMRETAERQSREKSRFLASAAHDLRQPMQALSNLLEASSHSFASGNHDNGTQMLAMAQEAAGLSRSTFNAVLDISRLESGFVEADYANFDIAELLEEVVAGHAAQAQVAGVQLRLRRSRRSDLVLVHSDRHLLSRIVSNLLANAIKYADPGKGPTRAVVVSAVTFANRVRVDVVDNGIGIERAQWEQIFQPFVQLANVERSRAKGVGLGLSIVQASIALLAGHRLDMTSLEGRGTRFSIELPLAFAGAALAQGRTADGPDGGQRVAGTYVLYVEDDPLVRRSTEAIFDAYGVLYDAFDSLAALEAGLPSFEMTPDLIITDYRLPNDRTADHVVALAHAALGDHIPVIVMTGEVELEDHPQWRILHKPVTPLALLAEIARMAQVRPED